MSILHQSVASIDTRGRQALREIYEAKRRRYTLIVLGVLVCLVTLVTLVAFWQGVLVRQIINSVVLAIIIFCAVSLYRCKKRIVWPTYVTVVVLHLIVTSGFITNGGVLFYSVAVLPAVPVLTSLLLGRRAAIVSCLYMLCLVVVSLLLTLKQSHPGNITPPDTMPYLAGLFAFMAIVAVYICFNSLLRTTEESESQVIDHALTLEDEIKRREIAETRAREASEAKAQFLATISHELKTPLNGIVGFNQILARQELTEKGQLCVDHIRQSTGELVRKIDDLLEFTELFSERITLTRSWFVLTDVFKSLESEFVTKKETNQNSLVFEIDAITNLSVESDAAKVQKMLYNLIDNALKFTKNGRVVVSASIHDEQGEKRLVCRVSDEGIGISDNHIGSMFDVFTQQDMSSTRAYEGIGLGLATSYNYAVFMGGSLSAENNAEKGCTFTLSLPVAIRGTS